MRVELPTLCFVSLPLLLWSLPNSLRGPNVAIATLIITLFLVNLIRGINTIVWGDNVVVRLLVWCDITMKFIVGATVAIPACVLCISRQLALVAQPGSPLRTRADKRRRQIFECTLCIGYPCLVMALHLIVQGHRFDILQEFGCTPALYYSIPGLFILFIPPLLLSAISMVYATLATYRFLRRRATFTQILEQNCSNMTLSRYHRLMALACAQIILQTGFSIFLFAYDARNAPLEVWDNWADVHWHFSAVWQFPTVSMPSGLADASEATFVAPVAGSFLCFIFFGLSDDNRAANIQFLQWVRSQIGWGWIRLAPANLLPTHRTSTEGIMPKSLEMEIDPATLKLASYSWQGSASHRSSTWSAIRPATPDPHKHTSLALSPSAVQLPEPVLKTSSDDAVQQPTIT